MKITKYLYCTLACMCLLKVANSEISRDKNSFLQFERQLLNGLNAEKTIKAKRPFCNAFTGCGRFISEEKREKKKGPSTLQDLLNFEVTSNNVQYPVSLYKALLNAAKQNAWKTMDREEYDYRSQQLPIYLSGQMPLRDTVES
ncbi:uncharacterized protein LOC105194644 [Solenopsis invicta]|uniref:uncharacterized protein LOC105194644 n=1 Tax=Solenopsis invicta TaxID=13686 RepID=UPI000595E194|nr:uncharacterized protein LOC105194644 [Solenopsis invicta]